MNLQRIGVTLVIAATLFTLALVVGHSMRPNTDSLRLDIKHLQETVAQLQSGANVGATNQLPTIVALFETSLASSITSTAASMTLVSATDKAGTTLASSTYPFIIDEGTASEEMVLADCTGTTCTNMTRGIDPITGTSTQSSLRFAHRRGASVKITDGPQLMNLSRMANGQGTYPNLLNYRYSPDYTNASTTAIASKGYVDGVALVSAPNADDTTKGVSEMATAAEAGAGTNLGGTGARLVLGANIATSTCQSPSGYAVLVASTTSGKLDANCIATNGSLTFSGNNTWNGTSTFSGAVDILGTLLKPVRINGLFYNFPSVRAASSTVLSEDGTGRLSWVTPKNTTLAVSSPHAQLATTASTTFAGAVVTIPANTLGTNTVLRIDVITSQPAGVGNCYIALHLGTGSATTTIASAGALRRFSGTIIATSTSNQLSHISATDSNVVNDLGSTLAITGSSRLSIYSNTGTLYFAIQGRSISSEVCWLESYSVEAISQ